MKVKQLCVKNFRNLTEQTVTLNDGLNVFEGKNAQGKTNLLESIYLCSLGKSPRTDKHKEMINYNQDYARVNVEFCSRYGEADIAMWIFANKKKSISVNGVPVLKTGELLGYLNTVYFDPDELQLIKSSPDNRRRFMDIDLSQTDKNYFYSLVKYNKILSQRNSLLKSAKNIDALKDMLFVWDTQLAREAARIVSKRQAFCDRLKIVAKQTHNRLSNGEEELNIDYVTKIIGDTPTAKQECAFEAFSKSIQRDYELKYSTFGCQRDDIKFSINGVDLREYGSQGQQRTAALALKLAELIVFKESTGDYPVLLLDDVLSELDLSRQRQLLTFDSNLQIILTATHIDESLKKELVHTAYTINNGIATKQ